MPEIIQSMIFNTKVKLKINFKPLNISLFYYPYRIEYFCKLLEWIEQDFKALNISFNPKNIYFQCDDYCFGFNAIVGVISDLYANDNQLIVDGVITSRLPPTVLPYQLQTNYYINSLKEADLIRTGSIKNVINLSSSHSSSLYQSFQGEERSFETYGKLLAPLQSSTLRSIAVKVYYKDMIYRRLVPYELVTSGTINDFYDLYQLDVNLKFKTHGVVLCNDTRLIWLVDNCCYPDTFLHLVLV